MTWLGKDLSVSEENQSIEKKDELGAQPLILTNMLRRIKYPGPKAGVGAVRGPSLHILAAGPFFPRRVAEKA